MDIKEQKTYLIAINQEESKTLIADIKKLNDGEASLEELTMLTDIYGFFKNN